MDSASEDVVAYRYGFTGGPYGTVRPADMGGPATVRYLPLNPGPKTLEVQAVDRAGRANAPTLHTFSVRAGRAPSAHWKLTDAAGSRTAAAESGPVARAGSGVTFGAAAPSGTGPTSTAELDGTGHGFLTPGTPVVNTAKTFAVGAWVRPARLDRDMTTVSQDGNAGPAFTLGLSTQGGGPAWSFAFGGARVRGGAPEAGEWAHVLGLYDAETGKTTLYVNGREAGESEKAAPAQSAGHLQIGRARGKAGYRDRWQGEVGDVRVHDRVVVPGEAAELARRKPQLSGHWSLETAGDGASPELYGGESLKLGEGASVYRLPEDTCDLIDPDCAPPSYPLVGDGHLELDGRTGFAATDKPVVDTDDSFTVGVVVRLADSEPDRPMTVLSQGGANRDAFRVRYMPATHRWQLVMSHADQPGAAETVVAQVAAADGGQGQGQRLAVVYDDATDRITLYLDGNIDAEASATFKDAWKSTGGLQIGRARTAEGWGEHLRGAVDEVHAFSGALTEANVGGLGFGTEPWLG
ncbi:LamG-like jellyroll fold domain-containing protein [Streptomyces sp. NPDC055287]